MAFDSVERIMRDVNYGWLIRYIHMNGGVDSSSSSSTSTSSAASITARTRTRASCCGWLGVIIFLLMMATAFMGYVLPWGQMSFWGATVITNLFSAIPLVGEAIVTNGCGAASRSTTRR